MICSGQTSNLAFTPSRSSTVLVMVLMSVMRVVHQLRHVLVAGRDQHLLAGVRGAARQRADHVVRLDARHAQQRQALRLDDARRCGIGRRLRRRWKFFLRPRLRKIIWINGARIWKKPPSPSAPTRWSKRNRSDGRIATVARRI